MPDRFPKALLVDLDDTILAYDAASEVVWLRVCERYVDELPGWTVQQLMDGIGSYRRWFWSDPVRHRRGRLNLMNIRYEIVLGAFKQMGIDAPEVGRKIGDDYAREREEMVKPFPGAIETLETFSKTEIRLAMVTNGPSVTQRAKIDRFDLEKFFEHIFIEGELGFGKPDERVYRHAMEQLDAEPEETWMVGDNLEWEVAAPQRLGITAIWHDHRGRGLPKGSNVRPDRIIRSLRDLLQLGL